MLIIGAPAPDFAMPDGQNFHVWRRNRWTVIVAMKALSPTCSTECAALQRLLPDLAARDVALVALVSDAPAEVAIWLADLQDIWGLSPGWPMVSDGDLEIANAYRLVDLAGTGLQRAILIVSPGGKVALSLAYPVTTGRDFDGILHAIDCSQLTALQRVATPAGWLSGAPVMLPPSLAQDEAERRYPQGVDVLKPYLRLVILPT